MDKLGVAGACNHIEHTKIHPSMRSLIGESHDKPADIKEDVTAELGSVSDDEEKLLRKISHDFVGAL